METEGTLSDAWDRHIASEFAAKSVDQTLETMSAEPLVNVVPLMIGGRGRAEVYDFYANHFLSQIPPDMEIIPVSRTIGQGRVVGSLDFGIGDPGVEHYPKIFARQHATPCVMLLHSSAWLVPQPGVSLGEVASRGPRAIAAASIGAASSKIVVISGKTVMNPPRIELSHRGHRP